MKIIQNIKRALKAVSSLTAASSSGSFFLLYFAWQIKATVHSLRATALSEQPPETAKQTL